MGILPAPPKQTRHTSPLNGREPEHRRVASYEADPEQVGRVLLLYSGGLDTSVMLKWIQERYGAEIVTLTVNLGQPGEDWTVVTGNAEQLGAVETVLVDARKEFALCRHDAVAR